MLKRNGRGSDWSRRWWKTGEAGDTFLMMGFYASPPCCYSPRCACLALRFLEAAVYVPSCPARLFNNFNSLVTVTPFFFFLFVRVFFFFSLECSMKLVQCAIDPAAAAPSLLPSHFRIDGSSTQDGGNTLYFCVDVDEKTATTTHYTSWSSFCTQKSNPTLCHWANGGGGSGQKKKKKRK